MTQTVNIPADHRLVIDVPREVPEGRAVLAFTLTPEQKADRTAEEHIHTHPCPICAAHLDPVTGNPRYNAETVAAIEEGMAISRGEIPAKRFHSVKEMIEDLERDDPDDLDD